MFSSHPQIRQNHDVKFLAHVRCLDGHPLTVLYRIAIARPSGCITHTAQVSVSPVPTSFRRSKK